MELNSAEMIARAIQWLQAHHQSITTARVQSILKQMFGIDVSYEWVANRMYVG